MAIKPSKAVDDVTVTSAAPAWVGWLAFLIGVGFSVGVWGIRFRPEWGADGLRLFERPDDIDSFAAAAITAVCFSGAGAGILGSRAIWAARQWSEDRRQSAPDQPWQWRSDWANRQIQPERPATPPYTFAWAIMCLIGATPGLEFWLRRGGWPDHLASYSALAAATTGVIVLCVQFVNLLRSLRSPVARLHLVSETGVIGGPLEAAIEYHGNGAVTGQFLVRVVCERHWIKESRNSDGGQTRSLEVSTQYEDTHRAEAKGGLIAVRFGIPFEHPETTTNWQTPTYLWFVELEDADGHKRARFWTPVFKTEASDEKFVLATAAADRAIAEETPTETLRRYGMTVSQESDQPTGGQMTITVPACRAGGLAIGTNIFGWLFLGAAAFFWFSVPSIGILFALVFGLFGLLLSVSGFQLLFERRRVEVDSFAIRVRRSWLGLAWKSSLSWDQVKSIRITRSGSVGGQRQQIRNVVAATQGIERPNGSTRDRNWSIVGSVPEEAANAVKTLLEAIGTS